ncbi:chaperone protein ClpD, chloroplastic isoform X2 [Juglans microcarpa x Juglans regia]|uniref:chaperone protein ClpD, chloroplastic isoform X2 n=1 Tax=Juglans microcarpa x Juglans regia TaxID=2249226 RepID=UPI001B7F175D|nr:chaperone protein ClpD, chloroplastic isoform X2 [Juglans microcarpa x Juglans regia]
MQMSSICSPIISFTRTRHHFPFQLQFTRHQHHNSFSSYNANGVSICSIIGSHGPCGFGVLPAYYSFLSRPSSSIIGITSTTARSSRRKRSRFAVVSASGGGLERFTERAIKAVIYSQREAKELGRDMVFPQHLLLGLIAEDEEDHRYHSVHEGFLGSGISLQQARDVVCTIWHHPHQDPADTNSTIAIASLPFSISTKRVFEAAVHHSRISSHHFIAPEHISIALFTLDDGSAARVITSLGANIKQLAAVALSKLQREIAKDGREPSLVSKGMQEKYFSRMASVFNSSKMPRERGALEKFCVDLTARASGGFIDPVIGRETEFQRVIQILCRRTKNNPVLLGESGVGKTAIAEGLAVSIAEADVPFFLLTKRVMSLDIALLMAGAKERGELEARVTALINEVLKAVHVLVGSETVGRGNKGSGLDIANLLKPSLGRGQLQCIASTTVDEYRMHFERDKAFARRFQPVWIDEPSQDDSVRILMGLREKYEAHHNCRFTLEAINAAVDLSAKYISDRYLPDKAIGIIDEAGSRACIEAFKRKRKRRTRILSMLPDDYWQEIRTVHAMQEVVLASKEHVGGSSMDNTNESMSKVTLPSNDDEPMVVGPDDIAAVVSLWSGIQVLQITADERTLLLGLDEQLRRQVVGQDEAVSAISQALKRFRVGLKDPKRPMAVMLFCGPTGVGKTQLTKALAGCYFGSEAAMLRLDMSEYMEGHSVSKLIGSPPGYVGYGEGGTLTEAIRRRPFTVILLDEIEKAHRDILNILLNLFEDGHLTDSQGRRVSFKNALVVMTSNVGSTTIAKGRQSFFGFLNTAYESTSYAGMKVKVMEELKAYFCPELLNRIDEVVVFRSLEKAQMLEIFNHMLREVKQRLISLGICLEVSESVKNMVCQRGYDQIYGARQLRRAINLMIEDVLIEAILSGNFKPGDTAVVDLNTFGYPFVINLSDHGPHPVSDSASIL